MVSRKRSLSDMNCGNSGWAAPASWASILDHEDYDAKVLALAKDDSEEQLDKRIAEEAHNLGLDATSLLQPAPIEGLMSSFATTRLGSTPNSQKSSQSRTVKANGLPSAPLTERRPTRQSQASDRPSPPHSATPSVLSSDEKRSKYSIRNSIKKMATFKKRKSGSISAHPALGSIDGNIATSPSERISLQNGMKSPMSVKSYSTSSSNAVSLVHDEKTDEDAGKRTAESPELRQLRTRQLKERTRFFEYQRQCLEQMREQHRSAKHEMHDSHEQAAAVLEEKNLTDIEHYESRQLEMEVEFRQKLENEKKVCLIRLRHMEAYCNSPSPPPTPRSGTIRSETSQSDERLPERRFPERKVTDKDYHKLAEQYRQRDAMDGLHKARIQVNTAQQERDYKNFVERKERALAQLIADHNKAETKYVNKCDKEENLLIQGLSQKASHLQSRWKLQGLVECAKLEQITGLSYAAPPEISVVADTIQE